MALSERPIVCTCRLRIQWLVNKPVTSLRCFPRPQGQ
jgi:hypothetical protein